MAYGDWNTVYTVLYNGQNYKITAAWMYRQDFVANATQIQTEYMTIVSKTAYHNFTANSCTYGLVISGLKHEVKTGQKVTVPSNGGYVLDTVNSQKVVTHGADGSFPAHTLHWYINPNVNVPGYPGYNVTEWQTKTITEIPNIDRTKPIAKITATSSTWSTVKVTASTNSAGDLYARLGTSGSWTKIASGLPTGGGSATYTFKNLTPGKQYTVQVYAYRTWNGTQSSAVSKSVSTRSIEAPVVPAISATDITDTTVTLKMGTGGTLYDSTKSYDGVTGSLKLYIYNNADFSGNSGVHESTIAEMRSGYTWAGLEAGKTYGFKLASRAPITNIYTTSNALVVKTLGGNLGIYLKTDADGWVVGIPYIKTETGWKQGSVYIKTENGWKQGI